MNFTRILLLILLVVSRSAFVHFEYYSLLDIYAFLYNYGFGQMFCITKYSQIKLWNSRHFKFFFFTTGNIWIIFRYNKSIFLFFFYYVQEEQGIQHIYNEKATTFVLNFFQRKAVFYLHLSCRFIMMEIINWLTAGCWQRFGIFRVVFFFLSNFMV